MAVLFVGLGFVGISPAQAGEDCDPVYGCPPPPSTQPPTVVCIASALSGVPGAAITITVTNLPAGTPVQVTLGGDIVGGGTADPNGQAVIQIVVPNRTPGIYQLFAVGTTFSVSCAVNGFEILPLQVEAPRGGRDLAKTGLQIALLLAVAAALITGGRAFIHASRRRRAAQAARPPEDEPRHMAGTGSR